MKRGAWVAGALLAGIAIAGALARTPDTDPSAMREKYGAGIAQFAHGNACGTIHYRDEGSRVGPALVLIHGSNSSLQTWERIVARLAPRYRLISLDLWGHGLTGPCSAGDYSARSMIGAVTTVLDSAGVERAVWVGNSMGGWVAWRAALEEPSRVSALILMDAAGADVDEAARPYLGARLMQSPLGQMLAPHFTPQWIVRRSLEQNFAHPERLSDSQVQRYWELLRYPGNRRAAVDRANTDRESERWRDIGTIGTPTLILWGEQDAVLPLAHARAFAQSIPNSELRTYPDAGHLPMEEVPDELAHDIDDWLSGGERR